MTSEHQEVRLRLATAADAEAVTRVFLDSRAAAMPYLRFDDGGRNGENEPDVLYRWTP
ncbi:hypothetical protein ACFVS7_22485 [Streptomyces rubiginosohelvolus]|uniref:hypothetical protein n=1 Tax=Streptomyces rubiginosohelvolus TaxID=67362 RepID=UPI0036DBB2DB